MEGLENIIKLLETYKQLTSIAGEEKRIYLSTKVITCDAKKQEIFLNKTGDSNNIHNIEFMKRLGFKEPVLAAMYLINHLGSYNITSFSLKINKPTFTGEILLAAPYLEPSRAKTGIEVKVIRDNLPIDAFSLEMDNKTPQYKDTNTIFPISFTKLPTFDDLETNSNLIGLALVSKYMFDFEKNGLNHDYGIRHPIHYQQELLLASEAEKLKMQETRKIEKKILNFIDPLKEARGLKPMYTAMNVEFYGTIDLKKNITYAIEPARVRESQDGYITRTSVTAWQDKKPMLKMKFSLTYMQEKVFMTNLKK